MQVCQDYVSRLASLHGWLASNLASSLSAATEYKRSAHPSRGTSPIMGRRMGLLRLIYAGDEWLTATGTRFWKKILMWLFLYELLEIPITWTKVRSWH